MEPVIRGRRVTLEDIAAIRALIATHGSRGRFFLSKELCRLWRWTQASGALKDTACRHLLLRLERQGVIELPGRQRGARERPRSRATQLPLAFLPPMVCGAAVTSFASDPEWRVADKGSEFRLYKDLIQTHHYLGYRPAVGPVLRYVVYQSEQPIACLSWSAAAWKVGVRDRFIGWTANQRQKNLPLVVDNTRFLILNRTPHLASHVLARAIRRLPTDWHQAYGLTPVLLETFVDTTRFKGTCYKAANWIPLGLTQGRGKNDRQHLNDKPVKAVFVYPLDKRFRDVLTHE